VTKVTLSAASACPRAHAQIAANTSETQNFLLLRIVFVSHSSRPACPDREVFRGVVHYRLIDVYCGHGY
jgi:hypothetical protein